MKKRHILIFALVAILTPVFIDFFIFGNAFPSNISNDSWAGFLGSYIGGLCTMAAVFITIKDNNKKIQEQRNEQKQKENEDRRMHIRPFLDTRYTYFDHNVEVGCNDRVFDVENENVKTVQFQINATERKFIESNTRLENSHMVFLRYVIRNVGAGSAVDMTAKINNFSERVAIAQNETVCFFCMVKMKKLTPTDIMFELSYSDVEGRGRYYKKDCIQIYFDSDSELVSKMIANGEQQLIQ